MKEVLIFSIFLLLLYFIYNCSVQENFNVPFATPNDTSDTDKNQMKNLLEIGSQADADKKYDVVSKKILGKINKKAPKQEVIEPEDPNCFGINDKTDYDYDYNHLKNYQIGKDPNKITSCCDRPSQKEIDFDWNLLQESLDLDFNLGFDGMGDDLRYCCDKD